MTPWPGESSTPCRESHEDSGGTLPSGNYLDLGEYCFFEVVAMNSQIEDLQEIKLHKRYGEGVIVLTGADAVFVVQRLHNRRSHF